MTWMNENKQVKLFFGVNFGLTLVMGILMGIGYFLGRDISSFPAAQMLYPAAGVMAVLLAAREKEQKLPMKFFVTYFVVLALVVICAVLSIIIPLGNVIGVGEGWYVIQSYVFIVGSVAALVLLLLEKREIKEAAGLNFRGHQVKASFLIMLLFLLLYVVRLLLSYLLEGQIREFGSLFADPSLYIMLPVLVINYFLSYIIFFGEEYGWRYFLQPVLQKRFGLKGGVLLLGVIWGLWHLPINLFYYSPDTWLKSILIQIIACICYSVFFGFAYSRTGNIWTAVVLHYINNNAIAVLTGSADFGGRIYSWKDLLMVLIVNGIVYLPFLFTKEYKEEK